METSLISSLAAGTIAGAIEASITYPTEYVKTTLQIQSKSKSSLNFHGPIDCVKKTIQTKGVSGLYKGMSALVTGTAAKAGIRFLSFEKFKSLLSDSDGRLSSWRRMMAGLGAGLTEGVLVVTPTETIKTKLIHDALGSKPKYTGLIHGIFSNFAYIIGTKTIIKEEGISGIYRGVSAVILRQGANSAVRLTSYDLIKEQIVSKYYKNQLLPWYMSFLAGSTAGVITVYATMPLDVLKTRMQSLDAKKLYKNSFDCFTQIIRQDGIFALWKGTTPRLGRLIFSGGIVFTVYEKVLGLLKYLK